MKKIFNSEGKEIVLNALEKNLVSVNQKVVNTLGYEIDITTLTSIVKKISTQKFFEIAPADYMPVRVGEGAWGSQLTTFRSFDIAGDFETGNINQAGSNGRLASADAGVDSLNVKIVNWAKSVGWTLFELQQASKSGNWDIVETKQKSRKRNWDLGIQKIAFLGSSTDAGVLGLFTQAITPETATITKSLKSMTAAELGTFCQNILGVYRTNCKFTAWPTHFVIPETDYLGLAAPSSDTQPIKSKLQLLEETFQIMTHNKGFKVLPNAYLDNVNSGLGVQRYALYNSEEESIRMDIPVDYNATLANSLDNFSFQNVGYGQYTGALAYRPLEMMYFQY